MWRRTEWAVVFFGVSLGILASADFASATEAPTNMPSADKTIDGLVAPIALYPDPLLAKVLIASTYPLELSEAAKWLEQNGSSAAASGGKRQRQHWDSSVESLVRVPRLIVMMNDHLDWAQTLGDAFLSRPAAVLDDVQMLRAKAISSGFLRPNNFQTATRARDGIEIEPVSRDLVYLPYYDPYALSPAAPSTRPAPWAPPPGYSYERTIGFLPSVAVPPAIWNADVSWPKHRLYLISWQQSGTLATAQHAVPWQHDPVHRRGVNYSTPELRARYSSQAIARVEPQRVLRSYLGDGKQVQISVPSTRQAADDGTAHIFGKHGGALDGIGDGLQTAVFSQRGRRSMGYAVGSNKPSRVGVLRP